jgi:deoxyribonucleoside regulator
MGRPRLDIPDHLAVRVAVLYYEHHKTHDDIADAVGVSRWKVARILQHAKDRGIVRIDIIRPTTRSPVSLFSPFAPMCP